MATIKISYLLNETGRKTSLLAGGNGKKDQTIDVPATPELMALVSVGDSGVATYDVSCWGYGSQARRHIEYSAPLTAEQAAGLIVSEAAARESDRAKEDARVAHEEATARADRDAKIVKLRSAPVSQWSADRYGWMSIGLSSVGIKHSELPDDMRRALSEEEDRRKKERALSEEEDARRKRDALEKIEGEREEWIETNGSERLRKGLAVDMIDKMLGVYRSERIAHDLGPEWKSWDEAPEDEEGSRLNPNERELDALLDAQKRWPDEALEVQIETVRRKGNGYDDEGTDWRPVLMMRLPWERDKWAIRYLDASK